MTADDKSPTEDHSSDSKDRPTIDLLYEQFGTDLFRFAASLLKNGEEAREVVQTAFQRAIERYDSITTSFRGWLFQTAYHEVALIRRKQAREKQVLGEAVWTISAKMSRNDQAPNERLESLERVEQVRNAIAQLTADQQLIVRMKIYDNKTFAVIAEELSIPLGTALTRMRSAMHRLKQLLKDDD